MGNPILARVNHGRWIADCPDCAGAELARDGRLFICHNCSSGPHQVIFPAEREVIELLLSWRPEINRNWEVGETVENLERENKEHGVGGM